MISKDPKKMAGSVLSRAFGGNVKSNYYRGGDVGNYVSPSAVAQPMPSIYGSPGDSGNFPGPQEDEQMFASGGEAIDEGLVAAADEVLGAITAKDARAVAMAMKAFFDQCDAPEMEPEEMDSAE